MEQQQNLPGLVHAPMFQSTALFAPPQFQKPHKLSGNIMLFHFISEHATGFTSPKIPRQLMADMHITKEVEKALGIKEEVTASWREQHDIPGSESLLEMMQAEEVQKRERSDTGSTAFSDNHDLKRARIYAILE